MEPPLHRRTSGRESTFSSAITTSCEERTAGNSSSPTSLSSTTLLGRTLVLAAASYRFCKMAR